MPRAQGLEAGDLDAVGYSYEPALAPSLNGSITRDGWEPLRTLYAERVPLFLRTALPGLDPDRVRFVEHHLAHAASAHLASPFDTCAVMTLDGRGERTSHLAARAWWGRVAPGPPTPAELGTMALTSVAIPPLATGHLRRGAWRHRALIRARTYGPEKAERAARTPTPARSQNV